VPGIEQVLAVRLAAAGQHQHHVAAGSVRRVQPDIVAARELERELVVVLGRAADADRAAVQALELAVGQARRRRVPAALVDLLARLQPARGDQLRFEGLRIGSPAGFFQSRCAAGLLLARREQLLLHQGMGALELLGALEDALEVLARPEARIEFERARRQCFVEEVLDHERAHAALHAREIGFQQLAFAHDIPGALTGAQAFLQTAHQPARALFAAREALEQAQSRLSAFQRDNGIIVSDERLDVETARLNEISSQLTAVQAIATDASVRRAQATSGSGDKLQEVLTNPVLSQMRTDLGRAEARMQELGSRLGDNHPQVIEQRAALAELRSRVESETRRVTGGVSVTANIQRQRETELRASLEAQRARVAQLKAVRDEGSVLVRDVENAQRAFDVITQRLNQTNMESLNTQSNIYVLAQASPPWKPSSPIPLLNGIVSFVTGLLLGVALALVLELRNRRLRTVAEVPGVLGLPVIGILPKPPNLLARRSRKAMLRMMWSSRPSASHRGRPA